MKKKMNLIGILAVVIGLAFLLYRNFFVAGITPDGFVIDAFGYIAAGVLFIILGVTIMTYSKLSKKRVKGLEYE